MAQPYGDWSRGAPTRSPRGLLIAIAAVVVIAVIAVVAFLMLGDWGGNGTGSGGGYFILALPTGLLMPRRRW
jgi:hypothetical protein